MTDLLTIDWDDDAPVAVPRIRLRDYQIEAKAAVRKGWETYSRQLVDAATGVGKTSLLSSIALDRWTETGGRTLVLENRDALVRQTAKRIGDETGLTTDIEMAGEHASPFAACVVASVPTLCRENRLTGFSDSHFSLLICDEAHHHLSRSYMKVTNYFHFGAESLQEGWNPPTGPYDCKAQVLGVTATPELANKRNLGELYEHVAFQYQLLQAVQDGWLVRPITRNIPLKIDIRGLRPGRTPNGSDYQIQDLAERLVPVLEALAKQICIMCADRKSIAFVPSVECARVLAAAIQRGGLRAIFASGECLDIDEKTEAYRKSGKGTVLVNCALFCLDSETEILTSTGFVSMNEMTPEHMVANWSPSGSVSFKRPKNIVRRKLLADEHFVSIDSRVANLRVTNTHNVAVRCGEHGNGVKKIKASALTNRHIIPTSGVAEPFYREVLQEVKPSTRGRRIAANAHTLRTRYGYEYDASRIEAERREDVRASLKYTQPSELSLDECRFIGFWIADGGRYKLKTGGISTVFTQSTAYPFIIKWIDELVERMGIFYLKKFIQDNQGFQAWQWFFSRGTGGGTQERRGIYHIEPYLNKDGSDLFWGLNEKQFDALVEGYWYGDGDHGSAEFGMPRSLKLQDTKKKWVELLCAIGPVRGWRCSMAVGCKKAKPHHLEQWRLRMIKSKDIFLSHKTSVVHEPYTPEDVWCVESDSGFLITRRKGKVSVTGNCEGADFPDTSCVIIARATKSTGFYRQMVGRGTRVLPGTVDGLATPEERKAAIAASAKPDLLILDPLWISDRIDLCDAYDLFTDKPEVKAKMKEAGVEPSAEAAKEAERDFIKALEKEARKHARKQERVIDPLAWALSIGDGALAHYVPETDREARPVTVPQIEYLKRNGIDATHVTCFGMADKIIGRHVNRFRLKLATPQQLAFLKQLGFKEEQSATLTMREASAAIDARVKRR